MENVALIFKRFFPNYAMIYTTFIRGSKMASLKKINDVTPLLFILSL